jgi:hypothetical protein
MIRGVFNFLDLWQGESMRIYIEIGETQKSKFIFVLMKAIFSTTKDNLMANNSVSICGNGDYGEASFGESIQSVVASDTPKVSIVVENGIDPERTCNASLGISEFEVYVL